MKLSTISGKYFLVQVKKNIYIDARRFISRIFIYSFKIDRNPATPSTIKPKKYTHYSFIYLSNENNQWRFFRRLNERRLVDFVEFKEMITRKEED